MQLRQSQDKLVTADRGRSRVRPLVTSHQRRSARAPPGAPGRLAHSWPFISAHLFPAQAGPAEIPLFFAVVPLYWYRPASAIGRVFSQSKSSYLVIQ